MDHLFNGTFSTEHKSLAWVPEGRLVIYVRRSLFNSFVAGDGVFSIVDGNDIKLVDLKTNTTSTLVSLSDIKGESGSPLAFSNWQLSPDMEYLLLKANYKKVCTHLYSIPTIDVSISNGDGPALETTTFITLLTKGRIH